MVSRRKILHISPHFGGGVGSTLFSWIVSDKENIHSVALLEYANEKALTLKKQHDIVLFDRMHEKIDILLEKIKEYDVIVIHFWNHPLVYDFLIRNRIQQARVSIWCHVSGMPPLAIIPEAVHSYGDICVFTNSISKNYTKNRQEERCLSIMSIAKIDTKKTIQKRENTLFTVGYVGTVNYSKMHPQFVEVHKKTVAERILVVGGEDEVTIAKDADTRFVFTGKVDTVFPYLTEMDVFGYLLNPSHYGTSEHVLQEALAFGIVPVVLNNLCESSIVQHAITGLIANTLEEYIAYIALLKEDTILYKNLSKNAEEYAKKHFIVEEMIDSWNIIFNKMEQEEKKEYSWNKRKKEYTSLDIFLESLGEYKDEFLTKLSLKEYYSLYNIYCMGETKGSLFHYYKMLQGEELYFVLSTICNANNHGTNSTKKHS